MSLLRLLADFTLEGPQEDECREFFERGLLMTLLGSMGAKNGSKDGWNLSGFESGGWLHQQISKRGGLHGYPNAKRFHYWCCGRRLYRGFK